MACTAIPVRPAAMARVTVKAMVRATARVTVKAMVRATVKAMARVTMGRGTAMARVRSLKPSLFLQ